jgi:hypothetical protein
VSCAARRESPRKVDGQDVTPFVGAFPTLRAIVTPPEAPPALWKMTDGKSNAALAAR